MIRFDCFYGAGKEYSCNNDLVGFESQTQTLGYLASTFYFNSLCACILLKHVLTDFKLQHSIRPNCITTPDTSANPRFSYRKTCQQQSSLDSEIHSHTITISTADSNFFSLSQNSSWRHFKFLLNIPFRSCR